MPGDALDTSDVQTHDGGRAAGRWRKAQRYILIAVAAVSALLLFGVMASRFGKDPKVVRAPIIGGEAPAIELALLEGPGHWSLDDYRDQVVVVNFWASWCLGCRLEHDDLLAAAAAYQDRGVVFVGIVFQDTPREAIGFLDELGRGYQSLVDPGSRVGVDFGVWAIPETFFIDGDGIVRSKIHGESTFAELSAHLDDVLATDGASQ